MMWAGDVEHRDGGYMIFLETLKENYCLLDRRVDGRTPEGIPTLT
jgi:hypothetical protein